MIEELQTLILLAAVILGGLTSWYLGYKESGSAFDKDKAIPSIIRITIAAIAVFIADYSGILGELTIVIYFGAYMTGLGIDAGINRLSGVIRPTN